MADLVGKVDAVLSTACGVGVQAMTVKYPNLITIPALNTTFMGYPVEHAVWEERCAGCGDCVLGWTGGICPIARCAKKLLNGPCGGSMHGKCEVNRDTDCAWQLIYDRLLALGRTDILKTTRAARDWRTSTASGQRKARFEEGML